MRSKILQSTIRISSSPLPIPRITLPRTSPLISASSRLANLQRQFSDMVTTNGGNAGTTSRLADLRQLMKAKQVDIYGALTFPLSELTNSGSFGGCTSVRVCLCSR